ncbi:MAG: DUF4115 domain-containing protein [Nitriliruptorales bacterium]|nr:DUF4115 domain-containing protein [Nitriliruptorales bacterium]
MSIGIGDQLREARQGQGRSVQDAADATRMRTEYIRALEDEEFGVFGGDVYAKGFLSTYARYLGLDPQPLLDEYRRYVASADYDASAIATSAEPHGPKAPPPRWIAWGVVVVAVLAGAVALSNLADGRSPAPADEPTEGMASPTPTAAETPTSEPEPSPTPSPTFDGVNLTLAFTGRCWINVTIEGESVETGTFESGDELTFEHDEAVTVRFGAPGAVEVTLNGEELGAPGTQGEPVTVTFTPEGPEET